MNVMINKNEKLKVICIGSPLLQLIKPNCGISERSDKLARSLQIVFGKRFLRFEKSQFFENFSSYMLLYLTKIYTEIHEGTRRLPAPVRLMLFVIIFFLCFTMSYSLYFDFFVQFNCSTIPIKNGSISVIAYFFSLRFTSHTPLLLV